MASVPMERLLWAVGVVGPALELLIAAAMVKRKLVHEFPVFFGYMVFHVFRFAVLFPVRHLLGSYEYFYAYWIAQGISSILGFAVLYELGNRLFRNYEALQHLGLVLMRWSAAVLLVLAVVAAASAPGSDTMRIVAAMVTLERSVRVVQCGLLVFLFLFVSYLGLSWRSYAFGVALGFGIFASVELVAVTIRGHVGAVGQTIWSMVNTAAFLAALMVWVGYLLAPQPVLRQIELPSKLEVEKWNQALLQVLHR